MRKQFTIFLILIFVLGLVPANFSNAATLSSKLKGKILLQVESKGEAWYVDPKTGEKNYMANGDEAYNIMRNLGVGITNKDLEKIQKNKNSAVKHSGKIFLQVESKGEAYYVDFNGTLHYLKNGSEAYGVMRNLGLGITNKDLEKISISVKSKLPTSIGSNGSSNVVEENLSDVAVKLYLSQLDAVQEVLDINAKAKTIYADVGQIWKDGQIENQAYLNVYPTDAKIYDMLIENVGLSIIVLEKTENIIIPTKKYIQEQITLCSNNKVLKSDMDAIFYSLKKNSDNIDYVKKDLQEEYNGFSTFNNEAVAKLDAIHNLRVAQSQQKTNQFNNLMNETNMIVAQSQTTILQAQNEINAARIASQPTYCSATRTGVGTVSVVCHQ